jgi:hypothetical protein
MVDLSGNTVSNANAEVVRQAVTDCYQMASQGPCVMKSASVPISADGTYIIADSTSNLTGRFVISWSSPNRNHFILADVAATRFDTNSAVTKAVDYAYLGEQVFTGFQVVSDTTQAPQLVVTIGNRNDTNPHDLTVTWYGDGANVPNLLPADTLGTTTRTNRPQPGATVSDFSGGVGASLTPGSGVSSVNCTNSPCTTARGNLSIGGGTATTGTIATVGFNDSPTSTLNCQVNQEGGTTRYGIAHSISGSTMSITAASSVSGATIQVNYSCSE